MKIQFENMRGRPALGGASDQSSASRGGAILPRNSNSTSSEREGFPLFPSRALSPPVAWSRGEETTKQYHTFASAALDPHPAIHNPLLPFGKFTQTVIDGLAMVLSLSHAALIILSVAGSVFGFGFLLFCRF